MRDLAPDITRQRLLVEGYYSIDVERETVVDYVRTLTLDLGLKSYGEPIVFSPGGKGKEENQGFDAFVPLIDSGISVYIWANQRFFSGIIYTCRTFDETRAIDVTRDFFKMAEVESLSF